MRKVLLYAVALFLGMVEHVKGGLFGGKAIVASHLGKHKRKRSRSKSRKRCKSKYKKRKGSSKGKHCKGGSGKSSRGHSKESHKSGGDYRVYTRRSHCSNCV